jgi:hypothetical protein
LSLTSTYQLRPPWAGIVTCYQAPLLLQNNKTSKRHRQTALDIVSQSQPWRNFGLCTATLRAIQGYTTHIDSTQRQNQAAKWRSHHTKPHQKKMDEAQHIPTSAQHGTELTMQNTDATQQVTVSYKTMLPNHKTPRVLQGHSSIQAPDRLYLHNTLSQHQSMAHCRWIPKQSVPTQLHGRKMDDHAKNPSRSGGQIPSGSTCL